MRTSSTTRENLVRVFWLNDGNVEQFEFLLQDGRIDYNEFVAMMQKGSITGGPVKMGLEKSFSISLKL